MSKVLKFSVCLGLQHQIIYGINPMINPFQQKKLQISSVWHYKNDKDGIIKRYLNESENWKSHLENCKRYILDTLSQESKHIAILGSGWLLDVPMKELLKLEKRIFLFDIRHPKQLINKYKDNNNVKFITADLTNGMIQLANKVKSFHEFISNINYITVFNELYKYDAVVSLNLLNQLDIILCDLLEKRFKAKEHDLKELRKQIQQLHFDSLPKDKSILITDYKELNYDDDFQLQSDKELIYIDLNRLKNCRYWDWIFDTKKKYNNKFNTIFNVISGEF